MTLLLTVAIFMVVTTGVLSAVQLITARSPLDVRLEALTADATRRQPGRPPRRSGLVRRALASLGHVGLVGNERTLEHRLRIAGLRGAGAVRLFLGVRTALALGPALVLLVSRVGAGEPVGRTLAFGAGLFALGHLSCNYWLRRRAAHRVQRLGASLPDCLDLMVVSLEAGLGLNATLARVGEERSAVHDELGLEFEQVARELREGRSREEALRALADRNGVEELSGLASLVVESDRLGASMARTLRSHADVLRTKRQQRAEEIARKLPIKILFPLALFILPALFVVTLGPAVLRIRDLAAIVAHR
jgi:tight adherence protein C